MSDNVEQRFETGIHKYVNDRSLVEIMLRMCGELDRVGKETVIA